jgi:hypothetical protein
VEPVWAGLFSRGKSSLGSKTKPQPSSKLTHGIDILRVKAGVIWLVKYELEVEVERWTVQQDLLDEKSVIANT